MPNGNLKLTLKGVSRAKVIEYHYEDGIYDANVINIDDKKIPPIESLANSRTLKKLFTEYLDNKKSLGNSIISKIDDINDVNVLTDVIAGFMPFSSKRKIDYRDDLL